MRNAKVISAAALGLALTFGTVACSTDSSSDSESPSPMASATESASTNTIVDVAAGAGDFTTLVDAVVAANLAETLSSGEFTVFAPSDDAFKPLVDDGTVETLLKDPSGQLTDILKYHVVEGTVKAADVAKLDGQEVTTVQGGKLKVSVSEAGEVTLTDGAGNTIKVVKTDIEADNGVIHVIDGVLLPS